MQRVFFFRYTIFPSTKKLVCYNNSIQPGVSYFLDWQKKTPPFSGRIRLSSQVYISGVRGLSTAWINAAVSQRIELTCDADASGAKVEI